MKNNDLKALLKQEANKIEINDYSEDILLKVNPNPQEPERAKARGFNLKIFIPTLTTILAVLVLVFFFAFRPENNIYKGEEIKPNFNLTEAKTLIGKEILAGGSILDTGSFKAPNSLIRRANLDHTMLEKEARSIHNYLMIGEMMLNKNDIQIEITENKDLEYKDYLIKMDVTFLNQNLNRNYIFYYNEKADVLEADTDDMDEVNSTIEGVILIDNKTYLVSGAKEVSGDEYETELKIIIDPNIYILVNQETEVNENEYSYTFYKDNKKVKELSQEFDLESKTVSIEIKEYFNQPKEYEMEFKFLGDNTISCEYEKEIDSEELELELRIYKKTDYYEYHFKNDDQIEIIKISL